MKKTLIEPFQHNSVYLTKDAIALNYVIYFLLTFRFCHSKVPDGGLVLHSKFSCDTSVQSLYTSLSHSPVVSNSMKFSSAVRIRFDTLVSVKNATWGVRITFSLSSSSASTGS